MSFHNQLEMYNWEYRQYLLEPKPLSREDAEQAEDLRRKSMAFHRRAEGMLERFDPKYRGALLAILYIQPGDLDYMFNSWLEQLRGLGLLED